MPCVLFIDDDRRILSGIRRGLRRHRPDWQIEFAEGGAEGVFAMAQSTFDIVVTDLEMPGVDGEAILGEALSHYPDTIRVVMSGYADRDVTLRTVLLAHQFLAKPCEAAVLRACLDSVLRLRTQLPPSDVRTALGSVTLLPATPSLLRRLRAILLADDASTEEIVAVVARDPSLSATVLKAVNSAFVTVASPVESPRQGVGLLGPSTIRELAQSFNEVDGTVGDQFEQRQRHTDHVAALARRIAPELAEQVTTRTVLSDVGRRFLLTRGAAPATTGTPTVGQLSGYLLGTWGLPDSIVDAVTNPEPDFEAFGVAEVVHVAEALVDEQDADSATQLNEAGLASLGLADQLPAWRQRAAELDQPPPAGP